MITDHDVALDCWSHAATVPHLQKWLEEFETKIRDDERSKNAG